MKLLNCPSCSAPLEYGEDAAGVLQSAVREHPDDPALWVGLGNALVDLFLQSRNWAYGSAVAVTLVAIMLITVTFYMRLIRRWGAGRDDVSLM